MLELLVLEHLIQRTSQRAKWTSGARDTTTWVLYYNRKLASCGCYDYQLSIASCFLPVASWTVGGPAAPQTPLLPGGLRPPDPPTRRRPT